MSLSNQDRQLAIAATALYYAAEFGCVPDDLDSDEGHADLCIRTVTDYIEGFDHCSVDDSQALADAVYTRLKLDHNKIH